MPFLDMHCIVYIWIHIWSIAWYTYLCFHRKPCPVEGDSNLPSANSCGLLMFFCHLAMHYTTHCWFCNSKILLKFCEDYPISRYVLASVIQLYFSKAISFARLFPNLNVIWYHLAWLSDRVYTSSPLNYRGKLSQTQACIAYMSVRNTVAYYHNDP